MDELFNFAREGEKHRQRVVGEGKISCHYLTTSGFPFLCKSPASLAAGFGSQAPC